MTEALRERFGKYHVLEKLAQGGMAEVYKVKTVGIAGFEKIQALKRILPTSAREGRFIRSFIDEARIAVELTHRNIVQVFDFGKADGELFLAMELIEGKDLRTAMTQSAERDAPCPVGVAAYIIGEAAAGIDYAHRKTDGYGGLLGIVHCDVSPSNVMLSTDGYVKILDFGIARASFASALERRRLRGKPRYMAPEQTIGEPPTTAADVFALGIIAWELLTGQALFRGRDLKGILESVRKTRPPRIDTINRDVPKEIVDAVAIALSRELPDRGAASDLVAACARSGMGGARGLAAWLAQLDTRPVQAPAQWQLGVESINVNTPTPVPEQPPSRPSRSITQSLINPIPVPPPAVDEPYAGFENREMSTVPSIDHPDTRYGDPAADPWAQPRATTTGFSKIAELGVAERTVDVDLAPRPSRPFFDSPAGTQPAMMRFEEDDSFTLDRPSVPGEATSYDELLAEPQPARPGEEPIDDDLGAMVAGVQAERRRSVVVAATVDGATVELARAVVRSLGELAYQRGGVVVVLDDRALVAAFGLEVAGEDDVSVAMGWALDACAIARDASSEDAVLALKIGARTGVSTGGGRGAEGRDSVTGSIDLASGEAVTPRIPQDAIDEARALAREASTERPLFLGTTGRLTSSLYTLREVPTPRRVVRGRNKAIEVVGPRGFEERDRARLERRGKLFGRSAQLVELETWLGRSVAANRRLGVLVTGAAGTGKSRLVAELVARRQAAGPIRVVTTAASPASRYTPFALLIDLYQAALGLPPARGRHARSQVTARLIHGMTQAGAPLERARAVASDLDRAMELRDGVSINAPEVADLRPRISAGLAAFRAAMTTGTAAVLTVIEDIHHADGASLEVLRHTLAVPAIGPELLILTARPDDGDDDHPVPAVDCVIAVGDLVGSDLRGFIADRLGDAATPFNIAAVLARGGGNPLFVEELAQAVREAGGDVPASARDVVAARLDRLSQKAKLALRFAAVLGGTVRARLLEELLGDAPITTGDVDLSAELGDELDELVEAGLLVRPESAAHSTEGELSFARGLVREVVYDSLPMRARRDSHARVGRLLASRFFAGRDEPPAVIAEHLERGGEPAGAAAFWLRAGKLALGASDAASAAVHFTRTLTLEKELGAAPPSATSRARRREALTGREEAHRLLGDLVTDATDLDDLAALCEGEPGRQADVANRRAMRFLRLGDYSGAHVASVAAENFATAANDDRLRGEALRVRGEILERTGLYDEALGVVGTARELFHRRGAFQEEMAAMIGRGRIHLMRAHYALARDAYAPVLAMIDKTGDPWLERIVKNHVAVIEMCLGNFAGAMVAARRSLELCRRYGDRAREGDALSVGAIILLEVGLYDEAAAMFAEALDILQRTASRWSRADSLIYAGTCEVRRGMPSGLAKIDEALVEARALGARYIEANALVTRGGERLRRGELDEAIADCEAGAEAARGATLVGYEIQGLARAGLARARRATGDDRAIARRLAERALVSLDDQKYLEGSEEEVLLACAEVLGNPGDLVTRAKASAERKLALLTDPAWRAAFAARLEIAALR